MVKERRERQRQADQVMPRQLIPESHLQRKVKRVIQEFYPSNSKVHPDVAAGHPKVNLVNEEATITGVYSNIFTVEEASGGCLKCHSLQYADIIIYAIAVAEDGSVTTTKKRVTNADVQDAPPSGGKLLSSTRKTKTMAPLETMVFSNALELD